MKFKWLAAVRIETNVYVDDEKLYCHTVNISSLLGSYLAILAYSSFANS